MKLETVVMTDCSATALLLAMALCFSGARVIAADGPPNVSAKEVETLRKAAGQGDAAAQFNLGYCYFYGHGLPKDQAEAVKWLRKSANQGNALAQHILGLCYSTGEGVAKDNVMACMWLDIAVRSGNADATKPREIVAGKMTSGQIAEARRLSREWKPKSEAVDP